MKKYRIDITNLKKRSLEISKDFCQHNNNICKKENSKVEFFNSHINFNNFKFYQKFIDYMNITALNNYPISINK